MATTLDTIAVEFGAQWTGGGVINRIITDLSRVSRATREIYNPVASTGIIKGIDAQSLAYSEAASSALKYAAQIKNIEAQFGQLGRAMAGFTQKGDLFHGISADQAALKYRELAIQSNQLKASLAGVSDVAGSSAAGLNKFITTLAPLAVGIGAVVGAVVLATKAFGAWRDMAEQGAQVRQTAESFRFLTQEVYKIPGLLESMRAASRGTISDFQLMSSYMTLISGTTPEFGAAISAAVPQLIEIAKAANVLNPALGDTTFFFESLARGIKRTEYRLIDNLGLNVRVGEANRKYAAQLGKTVQELTAVERQQAFLNETLRVGQLLIQQIGGDVDALTDPYQQLTANTANLKDSLNALASITFAPVASSLAETSGVAAEFVSNIRQIAETQTGLTGGIQFGDGLFGELIDNMRVFIPLVGPVTVALDHLTQGMSEFNLLMETLRGGGSFDDFLESQRTGVGNLSAPITKVTGDLSEGQAAWDAWKRTASGAVATGREVGAAMGSVGDKSSGAVGPISENAAALAKLRATILGLGLDKTAYDFSAAGAKASQMEAAIARLNGVLAVYARGPWQNVNLENMDRQREIIDGIRQAWADLNAEREAGISESWLDAFGGGEFDSDLVIGSLRNIGWAMITTGGAVESQTEQWEELNKEYERAKEKLWKLNQGIGVQGDEADSVAERIANQAAEVANYERILGELSTTIESMPTTTERRWIGLNLNDVAIFEKFIDIAGNSGSTAAQLGQLGVAMGLFGENTADAMAKVALVDTILENLNLKLQAGQIDVSDIPGAISGAIAVLEQDLPLQEIMVQVRANFQNARQTVEREMMLPEEDRTRQLDIGANMNPALAAIAETTGLIQQTQSQFKITADDEPARGTFDAIVRDIQNADPILTIRGVYVPPNNLPGGVATSTSRPPLPGQRARWNENVAMSPGAFESWDMPAVIGKPLVAGGNQVALQNYFYGPVGAEGARQVILQASSDAADQLVTIMKRSGYKI